MFRTLLDLIYPRSCTSCGRILNEKEKCICTPCLIEFNKKIKFSISEQQIKSKFGIEFMPDKAFSLFSFNREISALIHALKYKDQHHIAVYLAEWFVEHYFKQQEIQPHCIIPVPINPYKRLTRGYNQTELIAIELEKRTGIPVLFSALERSKGTWKLAGKSRKARYELISGLYLAGKEIGQVSNKHVLMLDDVITTGATLEHCGKILRSSGAPKIDVITVSSVY